MLSQNTMSVFDILSPLCSIPSTALCSKPLYRLCFKSRPPSSIFRIARFKALESLTRCHTIIKFVYCASFLFSYSQYSDAMAFIHFGLLELSFLLFVFALFLRLRKRRNGLPLPPGPPGLPIVGNAFDIPFVSMTQTYFGWTKKYGM
jgi:hypothetical protein